MEPFLFHQVASEPEGRGIRQEDHALREAITTAVDVRLLQGRLIRRGQVRLVRLHEAPLLPQAGDGADVVQGLARNLPTKKKKKRRVKRLKDTERRSRF